jgi:hypothetical protein
MEKRLILLLPKKDLLSFLTILKSSIYHMRDKSMYNQLIETDDSYLIDMTYHIYSKEQQAIMNNYIKELFNNVNLLVYGEPSYSVPEREQVETYYIKQAVDLPFELNYNFYLKFDEQKFNIETFKNYFKINQNDKLNLIDGLLQSNDNITNYIDSSKTLTLQPFRGDNGMTVLTTDQINFEEILTKYNVYEKMSMSFGEIVTSYKGEYKQINLTSSKTNIKNSYLDYSEILYFEAAIKSTKQYRNTVKYKSKISIIDFFEQVLLKGGVQ